MYRLSVVVVERPIHLHAVVFMSDHFTSTLTEKSDFKFLGTIIPLQPIDLQVSQLLEKCFFFVSCRPKSCLDSVRRNDLCLSTCSLIVIGPIDLL